MSEQWFEFNPRVWPVNEGYFGETEGIRKILNQLGKLRDKYASKPYAYDLKIERDPGMDKLCKLFCEEFGFYDFVLTIQKTVVHNACTFPIGSSWDQPNTRKYMEITPTGYRYKKGNKFLCWVILSGGFFYNTKYFTHREVLGIILHEVGHNFSPKVPAINIGRTLGGALVVMGAITVGMMNAPAGIAMLLTSSSAFFKFGIFVERYIKNNYPNFADALTLISYYLNIYKDVVGEIKFIQNLCNMFVIPLSTIDVLLRRIWHYISMLIRAPGNICFLVTGYSDEQFADSFPAMYGLGPDIASALDKLSSMKQGYVSQEVIADECPLIAALYDLCSLPVYIALAPLDMHPAVFERIKNVQRVLEEEAANTGNPRLKARVAEDNRKLTKYLNEYYNINHNYLEEMNKRKGIRLANDDYFSRNYYALLLHVLGGDIRHHVADKLFDARGAISSKRDREEMASSK